jgi:hypothetical protein
MIISFAILSVATLLCTSFFEHMETQEEIISRLEELLQLPVEETMHEANELKSAFYAINHQKLEQQKLDHRETGAQMEDFVAVPNALEDVFKELFNKYRDNKAKYVHQKEEAEKKSLAQKTEVLKGLKDLIDNEQNIGKSFDRFKDFQDRWKSIGPVPKEKATDLNTEYRAQVDRFYYNITINKELKEYDLSKNLEIRNMIVSKLEELATADKIKEIEFILAAAKEEWDDAGPVKPEYFQGLRERYYEATKVLHKKIQDHYSERKSEMETNLDAKKQMVARVLELASMEGASLSKWNKNTEEVMKLREDWKLIGMVERKHNNAVWNEFKAALDNFFDKKKEFLGEARESFQGHRSEKEKLIERAEQLKDSTDWKEATDKFKRLQDDWKKIGSAGQRDENKLWTRFRGICDDFFNRKKAFFDTLDDRQAANLKLKEEVLTKMNTTKLEGSKEDGLAAIKAFGKEWSAIEHVPKNDMKRVSDDFDKANDRLYAQLKMDKGQVENVRFKDKVDRMSEGKEGADQLYKEEQFFRKKIDEKKDELMKYENNMAFFKHAKPDNPLLISAQKTIATLKSELAHFEEKLKVLRVTQRKLQD